MNARITWLATMTFATLTLPPATPAVQGGLLTTVAGTLTTSDGTYGGCMAALGQPVNTANPTPNCPPNSGWVAFSCDGTYAPKDMAFRMLDQAQLAFALQKTVYVVIDDTKKHNGYCTAVRLDVWQ